MDYAEREGLRPKGNVPNLRFKEFEGEWSVTTLQKDCKVNPTNEKIADKFVYVDLESVTQGQLNKHQILTKEEAPSRAQRVLHTDDILFQCVRPYQMNNYMVKDAMSNIQWVASTGYAQIRTQIDYPTFLYYVLNTPKYNKAVMVRCTGSSYPAINSDDLSKIPFYKCGIAEQRKIATFLSLLDERIATQSKIIDKLQSLIKGIRNDVFGKLRKNIGFNAVVGDVLYYEQPQSYIVEDAEYTYEGTPVLTANKAFVLGYTLETDGIYDKGDCIIFDDFTLDCKYVDFPFKVKSSAIKILKAKNKELLRYTFEFLKYLDLSTEEHKRHYIAETQNQEIILPTEQMVKTIAHIFSTLSLRMETAVKQRNVFEKQKQYLLRQMFI